MKLYEVTVTLRGHVRAESPEEARRWSVDIKRDSYGDVDVREVSDAKYADPDELTWGDHKSDMTVADHFKAVGDGR